MGLLLDDHYWAKQINDLYTTMNQGGEEAGLRGVRLACDALSALVNDPDFANDIVLIIRDVPLENLERVKQSEHFQDFLDSVVAHEKRLFQKAGVREDAAEQALRDLRSCATEEDTSNSLRDLEGKIRHCRRLICELGENRRERIWKAIAGIGTISIDAAAAGGAAAVVISSGGAGAAGAAAVGTLAGISAGKGADMIHSAIKDRW